MRASAVLLVLVLTFAAISAAPVAAAQAKPGCDERLSVEEVCDLYADADETRECVKDLRWCIFGPI